MDWSLILVLCVPLALCLMAWIFYLKRDSLTHWEFSLGVKGIRFSSDFAPQAKAAPSASAEKSALVKQPIIADNLLDKPAIKKPARAKSSKGRSAARSHSAAEKKGAAESLQ